MELIKNTIFNENMLFEDILYCADKMMELVKEDDDVQQKEKYISKMYGNVFALLLRNGFICGKEEVDNKIYYCMNINDNIYKCEESLLKNILFRDFEEVINSTLHQ